MNGEVIDLKKIKTGWYDVGPDLAGALLEKNEENRPVSQREVKKLERVLRSDKWKPNGETIKLDSKGRLRDGQHRLNAIINTGISAKMLIVTGLDEDVFTTMDQGRKRTGGDVLFIRGVANYAQTSVACATFYRVIKNKPIFGSVDAIPPYGIDEVLERHEGLRESVDFVAPIHKQGDKGVIGVGYLSAFHYLIANVLGEKEKADALVIGICQGTGLEQDDPILQFRRRILGAGKKKNIMQAQPKMALFAKVVGMYLEGHREMQLVLPSTSSTFFDLIPGLKEAVDKLPEELALRDLSY